MKITNTEIKVRQQHYANGISYKFDNRRITVVDVPDGSGLVLEFKTSEEPLKQKALSRIDRNKIAVTTLRLTPEASLLLMQGLADRLGYKFIKITK